VQGARPVRLAAVAASRVPELGHLGEDRRGRDHRDAWNAAENLGLARQSLVRGDEGGDRGVELGQRALDLPKAGRALALEQGEGEPAGAVLRRGALADERGAGELKLVQLGEDRRRWRLGLRLDHRAHAGEEARIDPIGLGVGAQGLGEAPDAGRVQLRIRDTGPVQRPLEGGVIGAGRLEGDAGDLPCDPAQERLVPCGVVGDAGRVSPPGQRQASR
jgi:hypothetical protein